MCNTFPARRDTLRFYGIQGFISVFTEPIRALVFLVSSSPRPSIPHHYDLWRLTLSGMLRRVALVRTDISEELSASFIRVTRIGELETTLAVTSNRRTLRRNFWIEWLTFHSTQQSRRLPPLIWGRTHIQFPKRCVLQYLEYLTLDKVQKPSDSDLQESLRRPFPMNHCSFLSKGKQTNSSKYVMRIYKKNRRANTRLCVQYGRKQSSLLLCTPNQ
jgi:hypothetical protein